MYYLHHIIKMQYQCIKKWITCLLYYRLFRIMLNLHMKKMSKEMPLVKKYFAFQKYSFKRLPHEYPSALAVKDP